MEEKKFTWVETHKQLVEIIRTKRDNQQELIDVLKKVGITGIYDTDSNDQEIELTEIDPFTFFNYIYKYDDKNKRLKYLQSIAKFYNISIPTDTDGVPGVSAAHIVLFPPEGERNDEISRLWDIFESTLDNTITDEQFKDILKNEWTGIVTLTDGLFHVSPDNFFPIDGPTKPYLEQELNISPKFETYTEYCSILDQIQSEVDMSFYELSYESWVWNEGQKKANKNIVKSAKGNKRRYWLFSPGENAKMWDEFCSEGIMALGWDELGDLTQYKTKKDIKLKLLELDGKGPADMTPNIKMHDTQANFGFRDVMSIGDVIIVKNGVKLLVGHGVVTSDYYFDDERENYKSCRKVDWQLKGEWKYDDVFAMKTLTDITDYPTEHQGHDKYYERLMDFMNDKITTQPVENSADYPLNSILYGPPGTGKTYHTVLRAAEIVENRKIDTYAEALKIFKENLHDRIEFITFHQNYSYEDFIQGLRPDTENDKDLIFERKDGVFKVIADKALENIRSSEKDTSELSKEAQFNIALEKFQDKVLDDEDNYKINDTAYIIEVEEDAFRYTGDKWLQNSNGIRMKFSDLREFYLHNVKARKDIKPLTSISGLAKQHATYYFLVFNQIMTLMPKTVDTPKKIEEQNYVIVIDEINRANISRVFGELITLIEPDKRSHGAISLEARLPSGDTFIVPSNLYIIGTMNTADKSLALLDIALRRRFEFEAMYPQYELATHELYDVDILKKINEQIIKSKGYDFQIGHSYFMGDNKDLVKRMNKKVIPLLLEYYMNDEKEVKAILNNAGLKIDDGWPLKITGKQ